MWLDLGSGGCVDIEAGFPGTVPSRCIHLYLCGVFRGACAVNFLEGQRANPVLLAKSCIGFRDTEACCVDLG